MEDLKKVIPLVTQKMTPMQESDDTLIAEEDLLKELLLSRGLGLRHVSASWENIKPSWQKKAEGFLRGESYYFWGNAGTGKTYLAAALMKEYLKAGVLTPTPVQKNGATMMRLPKSCKFIAMTDLLVEIKASFDQGSLVTEKEVIEKYIDTPLLILDDIGVEKTTEWTLQTLYTIVDRRYRDIKQTIFTSNINIQGLKNKLGERIPSRITEMCGKVNVLDLSGKDRRI